MTQFYVYVLATLLVLLVIAWAREFRLRRALERIVHILITRWRKAPPHDATSDPVVARGGAAGDDARLR